MTTYQCIPVLPGSIVFEMLNTVILLEVNLFQSGGKREWLRELVWESK